MSDYTILGTRQLLVLWSTPAGQSMKSPRYSATASWRLPSGMRISPRKRSWPQSIQRQTPQGWPGDQGIKQKSHPDCIRWSPTQLDYSWVGWPVGQMGRWVSRQRPFSSSMRSEHTFWSWVMSGCRSKMGHRQQATPWNQSTFQKDRRVCRLQTGHSLLGIRHHPRRLWQAVPQGVDERSATLGGRDWRW